MKNMGIDIDKKKFSDYLVSTLKWFGDTIDDVYPEMKKEGEPLNYRRIDHLLSDMNINGNKIEINIQKGDRFIDGVKTILPTMNSALMKKENSKYFVLCYIDYI